MVRSRALIVCEPGQIREEAALSSRDQAPRVSLTGVQVRRERSGTGFETGCTVHLHNFYIALSPLLKTAGIWPLSPEQRVNQHPPAPCPRSNPGVLPSRAARKGRPAHPVL